MDFCCGQRVDLVEHSPEGLQVKPEIALMQQEADQALTPTDPETRKDEGISV